MQTVLTPLVNVYQTQLEASRRFADAIFSGTEKMDRVVLDTIHSVFNQQLTLVQAMASARDPQTAANVLQSRLLSRSPDDTMNYQKEVMRIFAEMQNDISKSLKDYVEKLGATASSVAQPLESVQQQANDAVYNPVTSVFSVWESAFKEAAALAKKNMAETQAAVQDATSRTIENAGAFSTAARSGVEDAAAAASQMAGASGLAGRTGLSGEGEQTPEERRGTPGSSGGKRK